MPCPARFMFCCSLLSFRILARSPCRLSPSCKQAVLQFVLIKPVFALMSLILLAIGEYEATWYQARAPTIDAWPVLCVFSFRLFWLTSGTWCGVTGHSVACVQHVLHNRSLCPGECTTCVPGCPRGTLFGALTRVFATPCLQLLFYMACREQLSAFSPVCKFFAVRNAHFFFFFFLLFAVSVRMPHVPSLSPCARSAVGSGQVHRVHDLLAGPCCGLGAWPTRRDRGQLAGLRSVCRNAIVHAVARCGFQLSR